ncbi:hypothetical protein ABNF97_23270 [Plantactinospora sp. B6F1]|uniref:hypothetical protein n=1 Tax=Plantactinospora sp. B6F1 TaxID=3158971 RepID=UPI0032D8F1DA
MPRVNADVVVPAYAAVTLVVVRRAIDFTPLKYDSRTGFAHEMPVAETAAGPETVV